MLQTMHTLLQQAEQISVEHVAQATPMQGASTIDRQAATMTTTLNTLSSRVAVLQSYLRSVKAGTVPPDYRVLRQIASVTNELRQGGSAFDTEYAREYSDSLMVGCLAATLKNAALVEDMVLRFSHAASEKRARAGQMG
jgi:COP9 signalosome complex subunit 6